MGCLDQQTREHIRADVGKLTTRKGQVQITPGPGMCEERMHSWQSVAYAETSWCSNSGIIQILWPKGEKGKNLWLWAEAITVLQAYKWVGLVCGLDYPWVHSQCPAPYTPVSGLPMWKIYAFYSWVFRLTTSKLFYQWEEKMKVSLTQSFPNLPGWAIMR